MCFVGNPNCHFQELMMLNEDLLRDFEERIKVRFSNATSLLSTTFLSSDLG